MEKETDKKYKVMKTIMDALEDILCSYQGRGHLSAYTDLDSLALFASLVAYGQFHGTKSPSEKKHLQPLSIVYDHESRQLPVSGIHLRI